MLSKEALRNLQDTLAPERDRWRAKNAYYYRAMERFFRRQIPEGARVLEIGCSTGDLLAAVNPSRGLGVDLSEAALAIARQKHPECEFRQGDVELLSSLNEQFDYIILSDVVGQLTDVQLAFENLAAACHVNTRLIITYYNYLWEPVLRLGQRLGMMMPLPLQNWLPLGDLANLLYLTGYDMVRSGNMLLLPIWVPGVSALVNRFLAPLPGLRGLGMVEYLVARRIPSVSPSELPSCTVVVPARNERGTIEEAIKRLPQLGRFTEVIFVEGHSKDDTWEECLRVQRAYPERRTQVLRQTGRGKGNAVREAFANAEGEVLIILDADLTVPPEDLTKFFGALASGKGELINGSRLVYPMDKQAMRVLNLIGNKIFGSLFSFLLDQKVRDTLCGTKALRRDQYVQIASNRGHFGDFDPFGDFDLLLGAARLNLKIVEVPVRYRERVYGQTNIDRFRHGWLLLRMALVAMRKLKFVD